MQPLDTDDVYGREHVPALTAAESAARDREAIERDAVPERVLMENAGRAAALVLERMYPRGRVVAALGGGNNGGDGLVMLRTLRAWGREVAWLRAGSRAPDPALAHGFELPELDAAEAERAFASGDVLVDGILGTGARGAPREPAATVIRAMNASGRPVLALDLPSGVDPTTGAVPGGAVDAAATVCFGWPKRGLLFQPGRSRCGRLLAAEIGFPPGITGDAAVLTPAWAAARLPVRSPDAHKGATGRTLVVAGSAGMAGAAVIAARGATRAGAGLVYVASAPENRVVIQTSVPEAIFVGEEGAPLDEAIERVDAFVVGPGLGADEAGARRLDRILADAGRRPVLLDADALNLLAGRDDGLREAVAGRAAVATPHPGEFARLTGASIEAVGSDPIGAAAGLAEAAGCVVLLKGAPSVVAAPDRATLVTSVGSSDLATAGMGDLLSGAAGAFLAAGVEPRDAAALALFYT
ncbi:MAG: NAD(P)H-hydrate dehydratase, partial [Gemmatimonadota bacterium]